MTTFTLANRSSAASFTAASRDADSFSALSRDRGESRLRKEDGFDLLLENGDAILLEQATIGDMWSAVARN